MQQRRLTEEDKRLLRERFAQLQKEEQEEEKKQLVEIEGGELESKKERIEEVVKEAMSRVNAGETLEDIFEFCFEAGKRLG